MAVTVDVTDLCDLTPTCKILSVTSHEPINGLGDGDTEGCMLENHGLPCLCVENGHLHLWQQ